MKTIQIISRLSIAFVLISIVVLLNLCGCKQWKIIADKPSKGILGEEKEQGLLYQDIIKRSNGKSKIVFDWGIPRFANFTDSIPSGIMDPVAGAYNFIERYRVLFRVDTPMKSFVLKRVQKYDRSTHIFFSQLIDSIPVFASELSVHIIGRFVFLSNGMYVPKFRLFDYPKKPKITAKDAYALAYKEQTCSDSFSIEPKLFYFNARLLMNEKELEINKLNDKTYLTYKVNIRNCGQGDRAIFIDAITGNKVFTLNTSPSLNPVKDFHIRHANSCRGWFAFCGWPGAQDWFDANGVLPGATPDAEGNDAFNNLHKTYDYYFNKLHRHGWDGHDGATFITLDADPCPGVPSNAEYSGQCNDFTFGNNMSTLDIMAHEWTHGVTRTTADLIYENQSGALNESYSDIFGMLIDDDGGKFTIGEGSAVGIIRRMDSPSIDHISKLINSPNNEAGDWGGVHTNSSIWNKCSYLVLNGGTHNGLTITGIGDEKTAQLYYFVLTQMLTSNSNFSDAANATLVAADYFANGLPPYVVGSSFGFTNSDVCNVHNALASVGLSTPDADCDGIDDNIQAPDNDRDGIPNSTDNCISVANPSQLDWDGDGIGNVCDTDIDGDGISNSGDNCPYTFNPDQIDRDRNGIGDICEDSDHDGIVDLNDNCRSGYNPDQSDNDHDGKGDVCDFDDLDNDGITNIIDNCPQNTNPNQEDSDRDGVGDACDNCPNTPNPGAILQTGDGIRFLNYYIIQADNDHDGLGDACDSDDDNDGILDVNDNCPYKSNSKQEDYDKDGIGDKCDEDYLRFIFFNHETAKTEWFDRYVIVNVPPLVRDLSFPTINKECNDCPIYLSDDYFLKIELEMQDKRPVIVIDDEGVIVAKSKSSNFHSLKLFPAKDSYFKTKATNVSLRNYRLIILQASETDNFNFQMGRIDIKTSIQKVE